MERSTADTVIEMTGAALEDAFAHHCWATLRLLNVCAALSAEQLETKVPGTFGSILETMRHLVGSDTSYLHDVTGHREHRLMADEMDLEALKGVIQANGIAWSAFLAGDIDPDSVVHEVDQEDGFERDAPIGIRLAQVLQHGTDHRSQICTALTTLGVEPPNIGVWAYGLWAGRVIERPPTP